jgi:hypothetical protein
MSHHDRQLQRGECDVASFVGDTSRSTYSGDLLSTVGTEDGQLRSTKHCWHRRWPTTRPRTTRLPREDTSSALVVPDAKRPLWGRCDTHNLRVMKSCLVLKPGLLLQGNPRYLVLLINCPETGPWLIRLLQPPTLHNRISPIHLATKSDIPTSSQVPTSPDTRLQDHERLGHISFKRMRQLNRPSNRTLARHLHGSLR